ncbi:hypothetical protein Ciccas_011720 [Cichlidogyrus casuarinus]|uniref:SprT-like domain-containing protein n=1 Tax=Cichlidogyrus casuarinus TaxID=1844966 RepID=A0ABD2PR44_9PLAT
MSWSSDDDIFTSSCRDESLYNDNMNKSEMLNDLDKSPINNQNFKSPSHQANHSPNSSSDSEAFYRYIKETKEKNMINPTCKSTLQNESSMGSFIVPDDEVTSDEEPAFYLNINNKTKQNMNVSIFSSNSTSLTGSSSIFSSDSSEKATSSKPIPELSNSSDSWLDVNSDSDKENSSIEYEKPSIENIPISRLSLPESIHVYHFPSHPEHKRILPETRFFVFMSQRYINSFKKYRDELTNKLFRIYNKQVFDSRLPPDIPISWNSRLLKTAGMCVYKKMKVTQDGVTITTNIVSIELSNKILTSAARLRDTLLHEACHAYVWIVNNTNGGHGPLWKSIAQRAMRTYPMIPKVTRCHAYAIETKFSYICSTEGCGVRVNRHTKSLDTSKKVCGLCKGKFILVRNGPHSTRPTTNAVLKERQNNAQSQTLTPFAKFVKENYKNIRQTPSKPASHADTMKTLSEMFKQMKTEDFLEKSPIAE